MQGIKKNNNNNKRKKYFLKNKNVNLNFLKTSKKILKRSLKLLSNIENNILDAI